MSDVAQAPLPRHAAIVTWGGVDVSLAAPRRETLLDLAGFTDLPLRFGAADMAAEIEFTAENCIAWRGVGEFVLDGPDDALARAIFFVCERLAAKQHGVLLHAAGLVGSRGALLLIGDAYAGKSTLTMGGCRHGLKVIGDDFVALDPARPGVLAFAKPLKLRGWIAPPLARHRHLRARINDLPYSLFGRDGTGFVRHDVAHAIDEVIFITRQTQPGLTVTEVPKAEGFADLLRQIRHWPDRSLDAVVALRALLSDAPLRRLAVGDGCQDEAAALLADRIG